MENPPQSPDSRSSPSHSHIREDFQLSLSLFKENNYPILIVCLIGSGVYFFFNFLLEEYIYPLITAESLSPLGSTLILIIIWFVLQGLLFGFFGAIMGMIRDIMGSGDGFTEIQNFIHYIPRYWGKFFVLSIIVNFFTYLVRYTGQEQNLPLALTTRIVSFFWFILLVETNPALVSTDHIGRALREDFILLRKYPKRIFATFSIFYAIFLLPGVICYFLHYFVVSQNSIAFLIVNVLETLFQIFYLLVGFPFAGFLSTIIYNDEKYQ